MVIADKAPISTNAQVIISRPLDELRGRLTGELVTADHPSYDEARSAINITMDRRPLALVQAASETDVAEAVAFAREYALPLSVRSGGHSIPMLSIIDDAIVADLSQMKQVQIDPVARIARVQAGATSGDLAGPANKHGLALTTGDTHSVGMGGLTTGGGIGFMVRKYGLAIDSLLSARVVLADGSIVTASAIERPDLFWAIRGGGGNFGIVTEFTYRLAPVGNVLGGELMLPATREVLRGYLEYTVSAPDELTTIANLWHAPPFPHVPGERVGELALSIYVVWTGSPAEGELALAPLRALATPIVDNVGVIPYPEIYQHTAFASAPHGAAIRSMFADDLSDVALDATLTAVENASSLVSLVQLRGLGGALARVDKDATAFAHRNQRYFYAIINVWLDPADDPAVHFAWTESLWQKVRHEGSGVYVNFLDNEGPDRVRDAYPPATYERLARIKAHYDPENLFRFNQNVPPRP